MEDERRSKAAVVPQFPFSRPSLDSLLYVRKLGQQRRLIDTATANSDFFPFASRSEIGPSRMSDTHESNDLSLATINGLPVLCRRRVGSEEAVVTGIEA